MFRFSMQYYTNSLSRNLQSLYIHTHTHTHTHTHGDNLRWTLSWQLYCCLQASRECWRRDVRCWGRRSATGPLERLWHSGLSWRREYTWGCQGRTWREGPSPTDTTWSTTRRSIGGSTGEWSYCLTHMQQQGIYGRILSRIYNTPEMRTPGVWGHISNEDTFYRPK